MFRERSLFLASVCVLAFVGCLPADDRPEPGSVYLTVESGAAVREGFSTIDGWTIRFDRFVAAIGDLRLGRDPDGHDDCKAYSNPGYDRTFDFTLLAEPSKVAIAFGLGRCSVSYRVRSPSFDTLRGPGVSVADVALMRLRVSDAWESDKRVSVYAEGRASRRADEKRFAWVFRRGHTLDRCPDEAGGGYLSLVDLAGGDALERGVVVRAEELFRRAPADTAPLHFDAYAAADADSDGIITLDELTEVAAPTDDPWPDDAGGGGPGAASERPDTLGELVYSFLLPRITRLRGGGACTGAARG